MRKFLLLLAFAVLLFDAHAQLSTFEWSNRVSAAATAKKALLDRDGNVYVWATASMPLTIGGTTYTATAGSTDNFLVKYNSAGTLLWSREVKMATYNVAFNTDSTQLLLCGLLHSTYNLIDFGNGVTAGDGYNSAGAILKVDGSNGQSVWVKSFDPTIPSLSTAVPLTAVFERNNRLFCVQGLKLRRLDVAGTEVWNRVITANGTAYGLENRYFNSFADDEGNTFYTGVSDNGNTTAVTLNGTTYTTFGGNNVCRTYISLDANGNTNWVRPNVNFQPAKNVEVTTGGDVVMSGSHIYTGTGGFTNHPFLPDHCNRDYNIFRANVKTGVPVWNAYSQLVGNVNTAGFHYSADGNLYMLCGVQGSAAFVLDVGTQTRLFRPVKTAPGNYIIRIGQSGVPDSAFTVNTFSGSLITAFDFGVVNLYRTYQGKFVLLFNKKNNAMNFANGNANQNATTTAYQGLLQFTPPSLAPRHTTTWTGATDGSWFTAANWTNGVPTDSSNAVIPAGAANYPQSGSQLYNFSTSKWAECGNLTVHPGATFYFGYGGTKVHGMIFNEGTMVYQYMPNGYSSYEFYAWNTYLGNAYVVGNGTIRHTGATGSSGAVVVPFRSGNNRFEISLNAATDNLLFRGCNSFKNVNLVKGNIGFETPGINSGFYVDSGFVFTPPSRVFGGFIGATLRNNHRVTLPIGDGTYPQPATLSLFNSSRPVYLTASFGNTVTGAAPNPATCTVNGQSISSVLNRGIWTVNADAPLSAGAYYNADFRLAGSTNAATANRYALLKRANSASDWQVAGTYQPAKDSSGYAVSSAVNITSFSDFAIGIANTSLPVRSVQLSVTKQGNGNQLRWKIVASGGDSITVQRSTDGRLFTAQASVAYAANGTYTDAAPAEKTHYRLKVKDAFGVEKFSNVVWMERQPAGAVQVHPTVVSQGFTVQNNTGKTLWLRLTDAAGKLLLQQSLSPGTRSVDAQALKAGFVFYDVLDGDAVLQSGKLVKQ